MIPVKLRLRNFMCYRDNVPPLLLDNIHVACLCGPNGAGKSALLDAVTWALWGEARAKSDDDLIHVGRDEMEVELEFEAQGQRYRVVRKRQRAAGKRAGKTVLELHAATGEGFRPITGNSVRETQQKLVDLLRMDYETFINSAFLVQGRADEFTLKPPEQRKEVLARVLNLAYYDQLEQRAREEARQRRAQREALGAQIAELAREVDRRGDYEAALSAIQAQLREREADLQQAEAVVQAKRAARAGLELKQGLLEEARRQRQALAEDLERRQKQLLVLERDATRLEEIVSQSASISEGYQAFIRAQEEKQRMDGLARVHFDLAQRRSRLEQAIEQRRAEIASDARLLQTQLADRQQAAGRLEPQTAALAQARAALRALESTEEEIAAKRQELDRITAQIADLRAANQQLRKEMEELKDSMVRLQKGQGVCPLCGTELGLDRCHNVLADLERRGKEKAQQYKANEAQIKHRQDGEARTREEIREREARLRAERPRLQRQVAALEHEVQTASAAKDEWPRIEAHLAPLQRSLAEQDFAQAERQALEKVTAEIEALQYDPTAHETADGEHQRLRPFEERYQQLQDAQRRLPQARQMLGETREEVQRLETEMAAANHKIKGLEQEVAALPGVVRELEEAETRSRTTSAEVERLRERLGAARRDLDRLTELEQRLAERRAALAVAEEEQGIYEELATAFSGQGLQALIIESALPEIDEEANRLLARMTDNRMHLRLESQRGYKSKEGLRETLEITIADELGTRPYETFSGGEAFRINLALRIALSRLLARRAGAPLPTLFLDEGFGTQDPGGRDRIVEAINAIGDDFERIIVITHIDELKEQFPARIEVEKTPEGSTFQLIP